MILYDVHRQPVDLGASIGRGGEASVYRINGQAGRLAKIYEPAPRPNYAHKLAWMVARPPANPTSELEHASLAWPDGLLFDSRRQLKGYSMPFIRQTASMLDVFNPRRRAEILPKFDRRYLHRVAHNLAAALSALHAADYIAGDLNESNVLVTATALVTLIDVDSFQVKERVNGQQVIHPCPVGKLEYTAPELQGKRLDEVVRSPEHDAFGLAVLIFQILMEGSHPFRAQWLGAGDPPSLEARIARGAFPYTSAPSLLVQPPKGSLPIDTLHPWLVELVRRCFVDGYQNPALRPTPEQWGRALGEAEEALVACPAGHLYSNHLRACPVCARAQSSAPAARRPAPARTPAWGAPRPPQPGAAASAANQRRSAVPSYTTIARGRASSPAAAINPGAGRPAQGVPQSGANRPGGPAATRPAGTVLNAGPAPAARPAGTAFGPVVIHRPRSGQAAPWLRPQSAPRPPLWGSIFSAPGGMTTARPSGMGFGRWMWKRTYRSFFIGGVNGALAGAVPGIGVGMFTAAGSTELPWPLLITLGGAAGGFLRGWNPGKRVGAWVERNIGWQRVMVGLGAFMGAVMGLLVSLPFFWAIFPLFLFPALGARIGRSSGRDLWAVGTRIGWHRIWAVVVAGMMAGFGWMVAGLAGINGLNELAPHFMSALEYGGVRSVLLTLLSGGFTGALGGLVAGTVSDFVSGLIGLTD